MIDIDRGVIRTKKIYLEEEPNSLTFKVTQKDDEGIKLREQNTGEEEYITWSEVKDAGLEADKEGAMNFLYKRLEEKEDFDRFTGGIYTVKLSFLADAIVELEEIDSSASDSIKSDKEMTKVRLLDKGEVVVNENYRDLENAWIDFRRNKDMGMYDD